MPDSSKVYFIHKKFFLICVLILAFIVGWILFRPQAKPVGSCAQMNLKGFTRVTPKNSNFNPALDRNHDGVEC